MQMFSLRETSTAGSIFASVDLLRTNRSFPAEYAAKRNGNYAVKLCRAYHHYKLEKWRHGAASGSMCEPTYHSRALT